MSDERTLTTLCRRLDADHALDVDAVDPTPADVVAHLLERPDDAWEVLLQLAGRVAGPWVDETIPRGEIMRRYRYGTTWLLIEAESLPAGFVDVNSYAGKRPAVQHDSMADAKHAADAALTAAGWVLADKEIIGRTIDHGATGALAPTCGPRFGADDD